MNTSTSAQKVPVKTSRHILAYTGVWFAVVAWGASFVAARVLLTTETGDQVPLSPTVLAALRFGIASLFFVVPLGMAIVRRQLSALQLVQMFFLGQIAFSLYFWLQYTGVQKTNASISSILVVGLIPVVTAFLSQFIGKEHLSLIKFGALLLGLFGVSIIVLEQQTQLARGSDFLFGSLCLIGNAFAFAIYSNLSKRWMQDISPLLMTGGTMISGSIGLLLLSLTDPIHNRWGDIMRLDAIQWVALLFLSLGCSVIAYFVYNFALTKISASRAAVYIYFEPVVAVVLGVTLLGERLSWQTFCGALVIGASVVIVNMLKR